jgi:hypothetical protein
MALLESWLPVGDSYYFIAHDYMVGRRRLNQRVMGIGLGAALLGELVLSGNVDVHGDGVYIISRNPPSDPQTHSLLAEMLAQPQHRGLRTWLAFLAVAAQGRVADRLKLRHLLKEVEQRKLIGSRTVLLPTDVNDAAWQAIRLERLLNTNTRMSHSDCFLAGLVSATGLMPHVLWDPSTNDVGYEVLPHVMNSLHPALHAIVRQAEAAVGQAVLAPR